MNNENKTLKAMLILTGILLMVLCWFMIPLSTLPKLTIYCFLGVFLLATPIFIAESISKKFKNISFKNITLWTIILVLILPVSLEIIYFIKRDSVLKSIPANNIVNLQIDYNKSLIYNNSVGNEWFFEVYINDAKFKYNENSKILDFNINDNINIIAKVTESDNIPDIGMNSLKINLKSIDFAKKNTFTIPVVVRENRGRYSGNTAVWELKFNLKRNIGFWGVIFGSVESDENNKQSINPSIMSQTSTPSSDKNSGIGTVIEKEKQHLKSSEPQQVESYDQTNPNITIIVPTQNSKTANTDKPQVDKSPIDSLKDNSGILAMDSIFTIGSTKELVEKVMGTPTSIDANLNWWYYDFSIVQFDDNDKVIGWNTNGTTLKVSLGSKDANASPFSLGSTKSDVVKAMGTPTSIDANLNWWYYGFSIVQFDDTDKVIGWNTNGTALKVSLGSKETNAPPFSFGSTKSDVVKAMGTPTSIDANLNWWYYGFSTVQFDDNDKVIGWNENDIALKTK